MAAIIEISDNNDVNVEANQFFAKVAKHNNVVGPWKLCVVESREIVANNDEKCKVKFIADDIQKTVATYELASVSIPIANDLDKIGTRIIAKRSSDAMPYILNKQNRKSKLLDSRDDEFYPGIIARKYDDDDQYCIFFDDGAVQMVSRENIRRIEGNDGFKHAHWNAKSYFQFYTENVQYEITPDDQNTIKVELNGVYVDANVRKIDRILAQIHFRDANRFEWIYLGSPRISRIYRNLILDKSLDNVLDVQKYKPCLSAEASVVAIDCSTNKQDKPNDSSNEGEQVTSSSTDDRAPSHECSHECVRAEDDINFDDKGLFIRPILSGWSHHKRFYRTPCGLSLRSTEQIVEYLDKTNSKLRINCFDLGKDFEPPTIAGQLMQIDDISGGKENISIPVNGRDMSFMSSDRSFNYITKYNFDYIDVELKSDLQRKGCDCKDNCRDKTKCSCWQLTVQRMKQNRLRAIDFKNKSLANVGYKNMRLENIVHTGIVECSTKCKCCAEQCVNRVVQLGLQHKLELFQTDNRGWGVRTKTDLPAGIFICIYAGCVLESTVADKETATYQFKLPKYDIDARNVDDTSDGEQNTEPKKKKTKTKNYDVVQSLVNYFPPLQNWNTNNFPKSEFATSSNHHDAYIIDALNHGNISRFFNHSCDSNLFVQNVYVDDDTRFPRIAFFTSQPVKTDDELTFDYRYELMDERETPCLCGAACCRKRLI